MCISRRFWAIRASWCAVALFTIAYAAICVGTARAQALAAALTLDVQPSDATLDLVTAPHARFFVVAHTTTGAVILRATLSVMTPTGITSRIVRKPALPSSGDLTWLLDVGADGRSVSPAKIAIDVAYAGADGRERIVETSISIALQQPQPAGTALKASILPSDVSIDELHPLSVWLLAENPTNRSIHVAAIGIAAPPYVMLAKPAADFTVGPGSAAEIPLTLAVGSNVPGTYTLVVGFHASYDARPETFEPVTAQGKITVGTPGISEALQFVGIPSLLLLPGILTISTFLSILPLFIRGTTVGDVRKPGLLVLAVTLSFAAAFIYPAITARFGDARDYLRTYDLRDVVYLWSGSIVAGLVAATIWAASRWCWQYVDELAWSPVAADDPVRVLRKLRRHRRAPALAPMRKRAADGDRGAPAPTFLVLPIGNAAPGQRWIVPRAVFRRTAKRTSKAAESVDKALRAVESDGAALLGLIEELEKGRKSGDLKVSWAYGETVGPRLVADTDYIVLSDTASQPLIRREE